MVFLSVVVVSFLSAWVWNEIFLRFERRLGALSQGIPNQRRWNSQRKPIIGGLSFFVVALALGAWQPEGLSVSRAFWAGGFVAFLTGLADDAFVAIPFLKLIGQLGAVTAALAFGAPTLSLQPDWLSIPLTLFWYAAVMNAFNMMDNMDGVSGSLALALLLTSPWLLPSEDHLLLYLGLAGALAAFLVRNWHPSHLYMGDNGSQFLGFVLAYWGTQVFHTLPFEKGWMRLVWLVGLFALLAGDTFWVIISRLARGQHPFHGGTDHLTHRLAQMGWAVSAIPLILGGTQTVLGLLAISLTRYKEGWVGSLFLVGVVGLLMGYVHLRHLRRLFSLARVRLPS